VPLVLCYGFHGSVQGCAYRLPASVCMVLDALLSLAAMHKIMVLTLSLLLNRPQPQNRFLSRFFIASPQRLGRILTEGCIIYLMIACLYVMGDISKPVLVALILAIMIPIGKNLWLALAPQTGFASRVRLCIRYVILVPIFLLRLNRTCLRRALHPLGAGPHIAVAVVTVLLSILPFSGLLILGLWAAHSGLVTSSLLELFTVRRLRWRRGRRWCFAVWDAIVVAVYANRWRNRTRVPGSPIPQQAVGKALLFWSFMWVGLIACLALSINWSHCIRHYRAWQRRHGVFRIQAAPIDSDGYVALAEGP